MIARAGWLIALAALPIAVSAQTGAILDVEAQAAREAATAALCAATAAPVDPAPCAAITIEPGEGGTHAAGLELTAAGGATLRILPGGSLASGGPIIVSGGCTADAATAALIEWARVQAGCP